MAIISVHMFYINRNKVSVIKERKNFMLSSVQFSPQFSPQVSQQVGFTAKKPDTEVLKKLNLKDLKRLDLKSLEKLHEGRFSLLVIKSAKLLSRYFYPVGEELNKDLRKCKTTKIILSDLEKIEDQILKLKLGS